MKAKRIFCIVAYDVQKDKHRTKIAKLLQAYGVRINYSVFECMFTSKQMEKLQTSVKKYLDKKTDTIVFYTVCVDCYTKTVYLPDRKNTIKTISMV